MSTVTDMSIYDQVNIPERSEFYHLEPIGIGTPYVESLSSYTARLANEHCITSLTLMRRCSLIEPALKPFIKSFRFYQKFVLGTGELALKLYKVLGLLTMRHELPWTTMVPWMNVISQRSLIRGTRAWCPFCYKIWLKNNKIVYDPLLWTLKSVTVCPVHNVPLASFCPTCKSSVLHLASRSRPGFCTQCEGWLGTFQNTSISALPTTLSEEARWQLWKAEAVGELLAKARDVNLPTRHQVAKSLKHCIDTYADGKAARFAAQIRVPASYFPRWLDSSRLPTLEYVLQVAYKGSIPLLDFLCGNLKLENEPSEDLNKTKGSTNLTIATESPLSYDEMQNALTAAASSDKPVPLQALVRTAGWKRETLIRTFPSLCRTIIDRYKAHYYKRLDDAKALPILRAALKETPPPSIEGVAWRLGCSLTSLEARYPEIVRELRTHIKKYYRNTDWCTVESRLKEFLYSYPPSSLSTVSQSIGKQRETLKYRFPEITAAISQRFREYNQARIEVRKTRLRKEICEIVASLEAERIYPSIKRVGERVETPSNMVEIRLILRETTRRNSSSH